MGMLELGLWKKNGILRLEMIKWGNAWSHPISVEMEQTWAAHVLVSFKFKHYVLCLYVWVLLKFGYKYRGKVWLIFHF